MADGDRPDDVILTELRAGDSQTLYRWINDPEIVRASSAFSPVHAPDHESWFKAVTTDRTRVVFAVRTRVEDRILGVVQLIDLHPIHRSAELVIRIGEVRDRGRGIGTRAVSLAVDFGFRHRNLQRIWLRVFSDNAPALRSYEKAGLRVEGTMRRSAFIDGHWRDQVIMAKLARSADE